jgi:aconitate hydratase 2/2-methylisocitrate dehydratase
MDEKQLREEGVYGVFAAAGARTEMPGCSLCMGNQARVADGTTVFSTSTRNFNNRMGKDARVYLGSAELAAVCALLGRIPSVEEYLEIVANKIKPFEGELYRYLNFDQIADFEDEGRVIPLDEMPRIEDILGMPVAAK